MNSRAPQTKEGQCIDMHTQKNVRTGVPLRSIQATRASNNIVGFGARCRCSPFNWGSQGADEETSSLLQRGHDSVRRQSMIPTIAPVATNTVSPACMAAHSILHFPDASLLRELRFFRLALV